MALTVADSRGGRCCGAPAALPENSETQKPSVESSSLITPQGRKTLLAAMLTGKQTLITRMVEDFTCSGEFSGNHVPAFQAFSWSVQSTSVPVKVRDEALTLTRKSSELQTWDRT